jgi:hypothetical protein
MYVVVFEVSDIGRDQGVEAQFLYGNTEFREFSFVGLDHVRMSFSDLFQLGLDALNGLVFNVLDLIKCVAHHTNLVGMDVCSTDNLVN